MAAQNRTSRRHPPAPTPSSTARPDSDDVAVYAQFGEALEHLRDELRKYRADAERVLRLPEVEARTGLFSSTIYEMIPRNEFPAPFSIGARAVGWLDSEITNWILERAAARRTMAGDAQASRSVRAKHPRPVKAKCVVEPAKTP